MLLINNISIDTTLCRLCVQCGVRLFIISTINVALNFVCEQW